MPTSLDCVPTNAHTDHPALSIENINKLKSASQQLIQHERLRTLGKGAYGIVVTDTAGKYCVKLFKKPDTGRRTSIAYENKITKTILFEALLLSTLKHRNIVSQLNLTDHTFSTLPLIMPVYKMTLATRISCHDTQAISSKQAFQILTGLLSAIRYLHELKVIHGDIKPDNVLLDRKDRAKLGDFGLAHRLTGNDTHIRTKANRQFAHQYRPPELLANDKEDRPKKELTIKSDIFAFGILTLELLLRKSIVSIFSATTINDQRRQHCYPISSVLVGSKRHFISLFNKITCIYPEQRPGAQNISKALHSTPRQFF